MRVYEERMMHDLLDFVYDNRDAFVLVFARSAGTAWERYLDRFIELEVRSTARYVREMREHGIGVASPRPRVSRILAACSSAATSSRCCWACRARRPTRSSPISSASSTPATRRS